MTAKEILAKAKPYGICNKLTGQESTEGLCDLMFTPQGTEFCTKFNFPKLSDFRTFNQSILVRKNFYIDAKSVSLTNPNRVLIAGDTVAHLTYDDPTKRHEIIVMHKAKVVIRASNYAVVVVNNTDGIVEKICDKTASIL